MPGMRRPLKRQIRAIALALLLPALMFRAAIPVGYMPSMSSSGQIELVMCSAVDVTAAVSQDSGGHAPDTARGSGPCHFSASTVLAPLPDSSWVTRLDIPVEFVARDTTVEVHPPAIVRTQLSRGPPALQYA